MAWEGGKYDGEPKCFDKNPCAQKKSLAWVLREIKKRPEDEKMIWAAWRRDQPDGGAQFDKAIEKIKARLARVEAGEKFEDVFVDDPEWDK